jgi:tetratricopeptide (TPR) repeat protein
VSTHSLRSPRLLVLYQQYLAGPDSASFLSQVSESYGPGTLQRLARHAEREVRRAAVLALGLLGDYETNHTLGCALLDNDRTVRTLAENAIRTIWTRAGDQRQRQELGVIIRMNAAQQHKEAIVRASRLIDHAPWIAEAWNQRATAQFNLGRFAEAIRDCHEALEVNPYHFVAATSMGQSYLQLENSVSALECFRRALRLNPDLDGVRVQVVRLSRQVEDSK